LHGSALNPPRPAPDFSLADQYGRRFVLSGERGLEVALFFGYTHCTDVCPQTLVLLQKARSLASLTPHRMTLVMISVDPQRDTRAAFIAFFKKIRVDAVGLNGSAPRLHAVYHAYGVFAQSGKSGVTHTDAVFLIDPQGRLREVLEPDMPPTAVAQDLRAIASTAAAGT
jgi:protein SCO1/2